MNTSTVVHALATIALAIHCQLPTTSFAQTPDGETPASEGVCDPLIGGTPGLYGLCIAYCEAQDLDAEQGKSPSMKLLELYDRRKTDADPPMPCVQDPCPCWTEEDLDVALPTLEACQDFNDDADPILDGVSIFGPVGGAANNARIFVFNNFEHDQCFFVVQQQGLPNSDIRREQLVSKEQGVICEGSARAHAASLGVACENP